MFDASLNGMSNVNHALSTIQIPTETYRIVISPKLYVEVLSPVTKTFLCTLRRAFQGRIPDVYNTMPDTDKDKVTIKLTHCIKYKEL